MVSTNNMMMSALAQLATSAPVLLVYLAGIVLGVRFLPRYRRPALLTLVAFLLLLLTTMAQTFLQVYLIHSQINLGLPFAQIGWMLSASVLLGNTIRAVALGLLLAAVFVDRKVPQQAEVARAPWAQPLPAFPPDQGITTRPS